MPERVGHSEVDHFDRWLRGVDEHHVGGLDVSVNNPARVSGFQRCCNLRDDFGYSLRTDRPELGEVVGEVLTLQVLHDQEGTLRSVEVEVQQAYHVRVLGQHQHLRFPAESGHGNGVFSQSGSQDLDGEPTGTSRVTRQVDFSHPSRRTLLDNPIRSADHGAAKKAL